MPRARPPLERKRKLAPRTPGKQVQLKPIRPALHLLRSDQQFLAAHIARAAIAVPVKLLEGVTCLLISRGAPERRSPVRDHAPIIIVAGLVFPLVQLRPGDPLAREKPHGIERGSP